MTCSMLPHTMDDGAPGARRVTDFLVSWDRLGFRLLVLGVLALMWTLQLGLAGVPWRDAFRSEFGGLMPWAFLAPWVLAFNRRVRRSRPGPWAFGAAHVGGMLLVYPAYWLVMR